MDRIIKFRGKDLLGKWRYGDLVQEKWKSKLNTNEQAFMIKKDKTAYTVLEKTVGQFIGLYDKNGKEIYEGDIVNIDYGATTLRNAIIKYKGASFYAVTLADNWELDMYYSIEVIGNIFDNKNLLEEE